MNKQEILNSDVIANFKNWEKGTKSRTYLTLKGYDSSWKGDRSTKVYYDNVANELIIQRGTGLTSSMFEESLQTLEVI